MKRNGSLNHIYRLVWSHASNAWVAVAESTKGRGKGKNSRRKLVAAALSLTAMTFSLPPAMAGPTGGQVVSGSASIHHHGTTTEIDQTSNNVSLNWNSFNIGAAETVDFVQPSAMSVAVNHILDNSGSQILGHLNANGQVFLINPNGIIFGAGAQVNVGGLVASTLDFNDASLAGNSRSFSGNGNGSIVNQGTITAKGGYVALVGNSVTNQGTIKAQLGTVALAAGSAVTLTFSGNELLHLQVDQSTLNNLAANGSLIQADGGTVIMTAGAKNSLLASVVNNSGSIEAQTVQNQPGNITLLGGMVAGSVNLDGHLDASAPNGGNGGAIETSAANVHIANNAHVTTAASTGRTGSWLIDPADFTIAQSGGDETGLMLSNQLATNNITIMSSSGGNAATGSGNINVNDLVSWSANSLTLNAQNNIYINQPMNGSGLASLALQYGQQSSLRTNPSTYSINATVNLPAGNSFSTQLGSTGVVLDYTVITTLGAPGSTTATDLQGINSKLAGNYALGSDINASATGAGGGWQTTGFTPLGINSTFTGNFEGLGHTISNLFINRPTTNYVGLFSSVTNTHPTGIVSASRVSANGLSGGIKPLVASGGYGDGTGLIENVALTNSYVGGQYNVGGLVGYANGGIISNASFSGAVGGNRYVGGLVGVNLSTILNSSMNTRSVAGASYVGGLVGKNNGQISGSSVTITSNGSVSGSDTNIGGLVGVNSYQGNISSSFVSGAGIVTGVNNSVGGLAGLNQGSINSTQASVSVNGTGFYVGGLVGLNYGAISNSAANIPALGSVTGFNSVGGLVGASAPLSGTGISSCQATGSGPGGVIATNNNAGGLVGQNNSIISGSSANISVSGAFNVGGLVGNNNFGQISNSSVAGPSLVDGVVLISNSGKNTGGLVGGNYGSIVASSVAGVTIRGTSDNVGGLVGLNFGSISTSSVEVYINNGLTSGGQNVGGLVGQNSDRGNIASSHVTGSLAGNQFINNMGGLVGLNYGSISTSSAVEGVEGQSNVGGLVGANYGGAITGAMAHGKVTSYGNNAGGLVGVSTGLSGVANSSASGAVSAVNNNVGGLIGLNSAPITQSYAVGSVGGNNYVGGLAGNNSAAISFSFADGAVNGNNNVGGLIGQNLLPSTPGTTLTTTTLNGLVSHRITPLAVVAPTGINVSNSYATGTVTGNSNVGGLVGLSDSNTVISDSYSAGKVSTGMTSAGLVGSNAGAVTASFWNQDLNPGMAGVNNVATGSIDSVSAGLTVAQMQQANTFVNAGWAIAASGPAQFNYWRIYNGNTMPLLDAFLTQATVTAAAAPAVTYSGQAQTGGLTPANVTCTTAAGSCQGSEIMGTVYGNAVNAGTYQFGQGLYSDQFGYDFAFRGAPALTINPAILTYIANSTSKVYGQANPALLGTVTGLVGNDTLGNVVNGTLSFSTPALTGSNAGTYPETGTGLSVQNTNYQSSIAQASTNSNAFTITKAPLSYTANATSIVYGQANPVLTGAVTGLVNGDTLGNVGSGPLSFSTPALTGSNAGYYPETGTGFAVSSGNYQSSIAQAPTNINAFYIAQAPLSYTATATSKVYGQANPALLGAVTGLVNGDVLGNVGSGTLSFSTPALTGSNAGYYPETGTGFAVSSGNYQSSIAQAPTNINAFFIAQAPLSYTATATSKVYGQANPVLLGAVTGLVNGDTLGSIANGTAVFSTTALTGSNVGTYAETGTGVTLLNSNGNYLAITQAPGNSNAFTITPASLSYVANPTSKVYGQANPPLLGTLSGLVNGDTQSGIVTGTAVFSTTALTGSNVGTYAETGTGLTLLNSNGNYLAITQALSNGSAFTITPASLTYNAFPNFKIYGQTNPALWGFVSGFVNGDTQASATKGTALFSSNATASSNVGFYGITGSGLTANNGNYVFQQASWNPSALFVIPAILTYNANSASKIYGQANPIIGGSVSGFVNSDTLANATTGTLAFSSSASPSSNVGKYTVTGSGLTADNNNYLFVQAGSNTGDLTVKPATLTYLATAVTENTKSKPKGLTGKITGYVLGQGSSVLNGSVMWTTTATASSLAGKYPILGSGLSAQNYIFAQAGTNTAALTLVNAPGTHKSTVVYSPDPVRSSTEDNAKPESQRIARLPDMANAGKREDTADMVLSVDLDTTRTDYAQNASAAGQLFQVVNGGIRMSASLK